MKAIIDTSTLISLAKVDLLELLNKLEKDVIIPETVYHEAVVKGEEKSLSDAIIIKSFISNNNIKTLKVKNFYIKRLRANIGKTLAQGDEAVLSLALQENMREIVTNDDGLGRIAMAMGLRVNASADIIFDSFKRGIMEFNEYEFALRNLILANRVTSTIAELYIMEGKKYAKG